MDFSFENLTKGPYFTSALNERSEFSVRYVKYGARACPSGFVERKIQNSIYGWFITMNNKSITCPFFIQ